MIGLTILAAFAVYLIICIFVVRGAIRWARRRGRSSWRWGIAAGLFMYLLVFWDHIPTLVLYEYYCNTKAGFWVYKPPEQWKAENPGVAETLTWREHSPDYVAEGIDMGYRLNERFVWVWQGSKVPIFPVGYTAESIVDLQTGETVVKHVRVWAGYTGSKEFFRFWTSMGPCELKSDFYKYKDEFKTLGKEIK
jgi:hypothetical protein